MEKIKQNGNAEYERALRAWVSSDVKSLVHFVFSDDDSARRTVEDCPEIELLEALLYHENTEVQVASLSFFVTPSNPRHTPPTTL